MTRYLRVPQSAGWVEDEIFSSNIGRNDPPSVAEHQPVPTGLLWSDGAPIMRAPNPVGCGKDDEW